VLGFIPEQQLHNNAYFLWSEPGKRLHSRPFEQGSMSQNLERVSLKPARCDELYAEEGRAGCREGFWSPENWYV